MKMMQNDNRTAITYYRYSSHRQGEQSIEGQRAEACLLYTSPSPRD